MRHSRVVVVVANHREKRHRIVHLALIVHEIAQRVFVGIPKVVPSKVAQNHGIGGQLALGSLFLLVFQRSDVAVFVGLAVADTACEMAVGTDNHHIVVGRAVSEFEIVNLGGFHFRIAQLLPKLRVEPICHIHRVATRNGDKHIAVRFVGL